MEHQPETPDPPNALETALNQAEQRNPRDIPATPDQPLPDAWNGFLVEDHGNDLAESDEMGVPAKPLPNPFDPRPGDEFTWRWRTPRSAENQFPARVVYVDPDVVLARDLEGGGYLTVSPKQFAAATAPPQIPVEFELNVEFARDADGQTWRFMDRMLHVDEHQPLKAQRPDEIFRFKVKVLEAVDCYEPPAVITEKDIKTTTVGSRMVSTEGAAFCDHGIPLTKPCELCDEAASNLPHPEETAFDAELDEDEMREQA